VLLVLSALLECCVAPTLGVGDDDVVCELPHPASATVTRAASASRLPFDAVGLPRI
jgi:hypothetical protein